MTSRSAWWPTPLQRRPRTREEIETVVNQLADAGKSDHEIAAELRLAVVYVRRVLAARVARERA